MKTTILSLLFCFTFTATYCQNLKLNILNDLTEISFASIDQYMVNAKGFKKIREEDSGMTRYYEKKLNDDTNNLIAIKVISNFNRPLNALEVTTGKNIHTIILKNDLLNSGYEYNGKKMDMLIYKKDELVYLIREKYNKEGGNQIFFMFE